MASSVSSALVQFQWANPSIQVKLTKKIQEFNFGPNCGMCRRIFAGNRKRKWSFINTLLKAVAFLKVYFNAFRRKFDVIWSSFFFFINLSQEMTTAQRPLERPHTDTKSWHKENLKICRLRSQGSEGGICVLALWNFLVNGFYWQTLGVVFRPMNISLSLSMSFIIAFFVS